MRKIKVGVIGVGYLGRFHAEKYAKMDNVDLVGVVDINQERAHLVSKNVAAQAYFDYRELFGKIDAVSIVVPTPLHGEIAAACLSQGIDCLIEKPMTTTLDEADRLIYEAESRGLILQIGHLERFNPAIMAMKDLLGTPMFIESHRLRSPFHDRGTDVDVVLDLMIHDIDIILSIVSSNLKEIQAVGVPVLSSSIDIANARLHFESGCVANITASRISGKQMRKIRIFQEDAYLSVDCAHRNITVVKRVKNKVSKVITNELKFAQGDSLQEELATFIRSVRERTPPMVSGREGRRALQVALMITDEIAKAMDQPKSQNRA
ncbi:MAG TPA: Gfo/Idh/MocA family oxidoreductase [Syntrophaceae bacterium]|nr:Gfo/Idh/MocA family oxidoreductase [Syntrophaceae bacterium]